MHDPDQPSGAGGAELHGPAEAGPGTEPEVEVGRPGLRALRPEDGEAAAALIRAAFAALERAVEPPASGARVTGADVRAHLAAGGSGAVMPGEGCVLWRREGDGMYVSRLAVAPAARGRGLATALLAEAEAAARREGATRLRLEVRLALSGNRRLFARFGFEEGESFAHPGFDEPTFVSATKPLSG